MKKFVALLLLLTLAADAGLPPTTSKATGDSTDVVTFNYEFPQFAITHTGTRATLGVLGIAGGGTGQTTAALAINALLPTQTSNSGKVLTTNGTVASWTTAAGDVSSNTTSSLVGEMALFSDTGGKTLKRSTLTNGQLLIGSTGAAPVAAEITGTANQVVSTPSAGGITLSLPQSIATTSSPTFTDVFANKFNTRTGSEDNISSPGGANTLSAIADGSEMMRWDANGVTYAYYSIVPGTDVGAYLGSSTKRWGKMFVGPLGVKLGDGTNGAAITASGTSPNENIALTSGGTGSVLVNAATLPASTQGLAVRGLSTGASHALSVQTSAGTETTYIKDNGGIIVPTGQYIQGANLAATLYMGSSGAFIGNSSLTAGLAIYGNNGYIYSLNLAPSADVQAASPLGNASSRFIQGFFGPIGLRIGDGSNGPTISASGTTPNESLIFKSGGATGTPNVVRGASSQSAVLTDWQNSSSVSQASMSAAGVLTSTGVTTGAVVSTSENISTTAPSLLLSPSTTGTSAIEIGVGNGSSGDRTSYVDFHGHGNVDNDTRVIRNSGANGTFDIVEQGTGGINIQTAAAGPIAFATSGTTAKLAIGATNMVFIGGTTSMAQSNTSTRSYVVQKGTGANYGNYVMQTGATDADTNIVGIYGWEDINTTATNKRVSSMVSSLSGTTANNRGSEIRWSTKPDNAETQNVFKLDLNGNVISLVGALVQQGAQTASPATGATVTCTANKPGLELTPAGTIATLTIDLPSAPIDGQWYFVDTSQIITATTFRDAGGTAGNVPGGPTTLAAGKGARFRYSLAQTKWQTY